MAKPYKFEHNEGPIFTTSGPWLCHPSALCFLCSSHPGFLFPHLQHALTSFSLPPSPASFTLSCPLCGRLPFQLHPLFLVDSSKLSRPAKNHLLREAFLAPALGEIHVWCALSYLSFGARVTVTITTKADRYHLCSTYSCKHFTCMNSLHLHNHLLRWIYLFSQSKNLRHRGLNVQSHRAREWSSRDLDPGGRPLEPSLYVILIFACVN